MRYPKWSGAKGVWSRGEERKREIGEKEKKRREKNGDQIATKKKRKSVHIFFLCTVVIFWLNQKHCEKYATLRKAHYIYFCFHARFFLWTNYMTFNSSHAVRDLGRVRQYPPWLLFAAFVESVGCPRYNPQKTRKQWRTRDRRFHWLWGWFPDLKIIFMM